MWHSEMSHEKWIKWRVSYLFRMWHFFMSHRECVIDILPFWDRVGWINLKCSVPCEIVALPASPSECSKVESHSTTKQWCEFWIFIGEYHGITVSKAPLMKTRKGHKPKSLRHLKSNMHSRVTKCNIPWGKMSTAWNLHATYLCLYHLHSLFSHLLHKAEHIHHFFLGRLLEEIVKSDVGASPAHPSTATTRKTYIIMIERLKDLHTIIFKTEIDALATLISFTKPNTSTTFSLAACWRR